MINVWLGFHFFFFFIWIPMLFRLDILWHLHMSSSPANFTYESNFHSQQKRIISFYFSQFYWQLKLCEWNATHFVFRVESFEQTWKFGKSFYKKFQKSEESDGWKWELLSFPLRRWKSINSILLSELALVEVNRDFVAGFLLQEVEPAAETCILAWLEAIFWLLIPK